ncbi:MBL fold metallo-hydrolase [Temperatibacter marinus]|uniref:MBL fold metallo-hydrolase n=1 Tax=Temperatibacter marinus TaxID=1456591 RepID=A0AA52EJ58_9PROT|nr:MBL fold metallo-hydrolase [Temperatibacter marinus]WND02996.1 MBL fold metallo-hydrolase [Temperatibacter marinus]
MKKVSTLVFLLVTMILYANRDTISMRVFGKIMESRLTVSLSIDLVDGLHVGLCGAGSPLPDPARSAPCTLVIAGSHHFLFDAGHTGNIGLMGFTPGKLDAVFLTHFHSDHIGDLGEIAMQRWVSANHTSPLPVYGPVGVQTIVNGFNQAYSSDSFYRTAHHGEAIAPTAGKGLIAKPFLARGEEKFIIYQDGDTTISAFKVGHAPVEPSVGYRIDYKGRSVLISGDTVKTNSVMTSAKNVDLLIHEGLSKRLVKIAENSAKAVGQKTMAKIFYDIQDYHTDPEEAAELAQKAGVRHLVFTHIVPMLPLPGMKKAFLGKSDEIFDGPITIGQDGDFFSLPAGSDQIVIDNRL